jgi:hypothetical protein
VSDAKNPKAPRARSPKQRLAIIAGVLAALLGGCVAVGLTSKKSDKERAQEIITKTLDSIPTSREGKQLFLAQTLYPKAEPKQQQCLADRLLATDLPEQKAGETRPGDDALLIDAIVACMPPDQLANKISKQLGGLNEAQRTCVTAKLSKLDTTTWSAYLLANERTEYDKFPPSVTDAITTCSA